MLLVQTPGSQRFDAMLTSVLNKSIVEAKALGKTRIQDFDGLAGTVDITESGTLTSGGHPVARPVAFGIGGTAASFTGARSTVYDRSWVLVRPRGRVRLSMLADGVRSDGRLSPRGEITLYPQADRGCTFLQSSTVGAPRSSQPPRSSSASRVGARSVLIPTGLAPGALVDLRAHRGDPDSLPDAVARQLSTESVRRNGGEGRLVVETCPLQRIQALKFSSLSCRCPAHDRRHPDPKSPARAARRRRARRAGAACRTPASPRERRRVDHCRRRQPPAHVTPATVTPKPTPTPRPPLLPFRQSSCSTGLPQRSRQPASPLPRDRRLRLHGHVGIAIVPLSPRPERARRQRVQDSPPSTFSTSRQHVSSRPSQARWQRRQPSSSVAPGKIVGRFDTLVDGAVIAQAAHNAGARGAKQ